MEINEKNLFFCDFETGGLKSYVNGVSSFYISKYNSTFNKYLFFYPQKAVYDFQALNINGLSLEELYEKGNSREDLIKLFNVIHESYNTKQNYIILCGWNISFDIDFLLNIYRSKNAKLPCPIISLDLMEIAKKNIQKKDLRKKVSEGVENYKLTTIYQYYFEDFSEKLSHNADYDVFMCEKLYDKFKELKFI